MELSPVLSVSECVLFSVFAPSLPSYSLVSPFLPPVLTPVAL